MRILGANVIAILAVILGAASLGAQSYTRTQSSVTYSQRNGGGGATVSNDVNGTYGFQAVRQVALPFAFPFFNRTYSTCWLSGSGSVTFNISNASSQSTTALTTPIADAAQYEAIHAFRTPLLASDYDATPFTVHYETGRVVFQWSNVTCMAGTIGQQMIAVNFQIHLLSSGEIQLYYGPETVDQADTPTFVSGIVNSTGATAFAGFGNVLTQQTVRPLANTMVSLVPSGFTQTAGVAIDAATNNDSVVTAVGGTSDVAMMRFRLTPRLAGGTVTQIVVNHFNVAAGQPITTRLFRDLGTAGVFDGADTQVGTTQSPSATTSSTFSGLTEAITSSAVDYIFVVNFGAITADGQSTFSVVPGGITSAATVWGGCNTKLRAYSDGPEATVESSFQVGLSTPITLGAVQNRLLSFEIRRGRYPLFTTFWIKQGFLDFGPLTTTTVSLGLGLGGGIAITDITELRLYRDGGTRGSLDGSDTLLSTITSPATTTIAFTGLSEASSLNGTDYLVTFSVSASFAGNGSVSAAVQAASFTGLQSGADFTTTEQASGEAQVVVGTTAATIVRPRADVSLLNIHARGTDTNVPAGWFSLQTNTGTATVSSIAFAASTDATTYLSAARLYIDTGTLGRLDVSDTAIGGSGAITATAITFGVSQSISTTPTNYLLVVDIAAAATAGSRTISLAAAGVTSTVTPIGTGSSLNLEVQAGTVNGVDITLLQYNTTINISGDSPVPIARVQLTPRGTGGQAPQLVVDPLFAAGGIGSNCGLNSIAYLEGAGPLGVLDSTDRCLPAVRQTNIDSPDVLPLLPTGGTGPVTTTRNILVCLVRADAKFDGRVTLAFRGFTGGTDVRWTIGVPNPTNGVTTSSNSGGGGGGGGDDGGCSTGASDSHINLALLAGLMGAMFVGLRMRRRAA